jgi:hypothetical protein
MLLAQFRNQTNSVSGSEAQKLTELGGARCAYGRSLAEKQVGLKPVAEERTDLSLSGRLNHSMAGTFKGHFDRGTRFGVLNICQNQEE